MLTTGRQAIPTNSGAPEDHLLRIPERPKPVIWVLQGRHAGDNAQAYALAAKLDAQIVCKHLTFNNHWRPPSVMLGASVASVDTESRRSLAPPWPELVIAIGTRSAPVVRWIKQQSRGRTKAVHLGRPRTPLAAFDLVITTPQYGLPPAPNVIEIPLPFTAARNVAAHELAAWRSEWAKLKRPLIAVAIGHAKSPLKLGRREAQLLGRQLNLLADQIKGSLLLIPSPRSEPAVIARIQAELSAPHVAYRTFDPQRNPYPAALVECHHFVATSDSISMISELISTGKPVDVFELPERILHVKWRARSRFCAWLSRNGVLRPPRDVSGMVRTLIEKGLVSSLGERKQRTLFKRDDALILKRVNLMLENTCTSDRRHGG